MHTITSFAQAEALLRQHAPELLARPGYSLDTLRQFMDRLGNPQQRFKVIHVAGTSGKTSTCYYIAALLGQTGKKVGLTVSPHVDTLNERTQINLTPLPEAQFFAELAIFLDLLSKSDVRLSRFECLTAFMYWEFARQQVDYAVVEVGVGGTLDATNVVEDQRKVCVITDIGYDHQELLGDTLPEIAAKKAGIITLHNLVFCYDQGGEIMGAVRARARQQQADLHIIDQTLPDDAGFLPLFQQRNFGLARAVVGQVLARDGLPQLTDNAVQQAARVHIPARMERFTIQDKTIIVDGAHNAQKLRALADSLRAQYPGQAIAALVAFKATHPDRIEQATAVLAGLAQHIIVTTYGQPNAHDPYGEDPAIVAALCKIHGNANVETIAESAHAWRELLKRPEPLLLITGSFYLFNDIRPLLKTAQ